LAKIISDDLQVTLTEALNKSSDLRGKRQNSQIAKILKECRILDGLIGNARTCACRVMMSDEASDNFAPVMLPDDCLARQYAKQALEELAMLKMDILGLMAQAFWIFPRWRN
jgi:DNA polymerase III alpha subunit